jgi:hypothetical protein
MLSITVPFAPREELYAGLTISATGLARADSSKSNTLPGHPRVLLNNPELGNFLSRELKTPKLDAFEPHLWKVAKQSSSHVTALSSQAVRGRNIILAEDPELHLVWIRDRIYIKPIPKYLLSYSFWDFTFTGNSSPLRDDERLEIRKAALGFLRTYAHLVRHKSDFILAQKHGLIPKKIRHSAFIRFITCFEQLQDSSVSPRYSYGELRLSRLNFWAPVAIGRLDFHKSVWQYGEYFSQFYGPLLFIFGVFAIILNAMQVALAVQSVDSGVGSSWGVFADVCKVFSVLTLFVVLLVVVHLVLTFAVRGLRELVFALRALYRRKRAAKNVQ